MTDEQLKNALIEAQDYMLSKFPAREWHYNFSRKFQKKMKELVELEKHPLWFYIRRTAAILFVILGISGVLLFGFSENVRADFIKWITTRFSENAYRYQNEAQPIIDISQYSLTRIVANDYQLIDRDVKQESVKEAYISQSGDMLIFTVMVSTREEDFYVLLDGNTKSETVNIGNLFADIYLSENPNESNAIVWQDSNGILFSIMGCLDKEQLIDMIKKMD
jgi:hypothetical protein